jgi:hypothetical protein
MHICFKIIKFLLHSMLLYMFRTLLWLEDATNTKSHGNQRLHVQWWKAPDDGHSSVRNM